jgi:hypothetical protein
VAGKRSPAKQWHFWRAGFWFRPALVLLYSLIVAIIGAALVLAVPARLGESRAMLAAGECGDAPGEDCLSRVRARVDGPRYRRGPGDSWDVVPVDSGREPFESVDVPSSDSNRLDDGDVVDALVWRNAVVAMETADGELVETDDYGHRGWLLRLGIGLFMFAGGIIGVKVARLKRRGSDGWWSTSAPSALMVEPNPTSMIVGVLFFGSGILILTLAVGLSVGWSVGTTLAVVTVLAVLIGWGLLRRRGKTP